MQYKLISVYLQFFLFFKISSPENDVFDKNASLLTQNGPELQKCNLNEVKCNLWCFL